MVLSQELLIAAEQGDVAAVQEWLDAGGDPDDRTWVESVGMHGGTLLDHVVSAHDPPHYYDPTDVAGRRLREQQARGHCAIVSALLARGATVDVLTPGDGPKNTPLLVAAIYERADIIRLLCQAGANVNYRRSPSPCGVFDFPLCLCLGCPAAVRELLRFGADPSMKCELAQYEEPETDDEEDIYELVLPEVEALRQADKAYRPLPR